MNATPSASGPSPDAETHLTVGDVRIVARSADPRLSAHVTPELTPFLHVDGARTHAPLHQLDLTVTSANLRDSMTNAASSDAASSDAASSDAASRAGFDSGGLWRVRHQPDFIEFAFTSPAIGEVPYRIARIAHDWQSGEVILHRPYVEAGLFAHALEYPLDELLLVHLLARHQAGIELHGCGLVTTDGKSLLFLGQSGAGKTTTANLWTQAKPGTRVLSDDRIIVRSDGRVMRMYGTPWHGEGAYALPEQTPLSAIFFLTQSEHNAARRMSESEAVARLFACSFAPVYVHEDVHHCLAFLGALAAQVPCYALSFVKDASAVDFVDQHTPLR
jgi:hypothetical protein